MSEGSHKVRNLILCWENDPVFWETDRRAVTSEVARLMNLPTITTVEAVVTQNRIDWTIFCSLQKFVLLHGPSYNLVHVDFSLSEMIEAVNYIVFHDIQDYE